MSLSAPMSFADVFQTSYVTNDLERAVSNFKTLCGIPEFYIGADHPITTPEGESAIIQAAIAWSGPIQVEIIQAKGGADEIYRAFLPQKGFGLAFHHFCARAKTVEEFEARLADFQRKGCKIVFLYKQPEIRAFYADARALLGHVMEYVWIASEDMLTLGGKIPGR